MTRTSCSPSAVAALAITAVLMPFVACQREAPSDLPGQPPVPHAEGRIELPLKARAAASIKTVVPAERPLGRVVRATAVIKPNEYRLAHVSPRIPGRAVEVRALLGKRVEQGEVLAFLDSLELGEKKSAFLQARTNLEVARRDYTREERLFKQQISSEREYLEAKGEFERSEAAFRAAREALRLVGLADADIDRIAWGSTEHPLSRFPLLAPFAGTVVDQHITIGELIEPTETPYTIADLTTVWALLDIYEKDLALVHVGDSVEVTTEAYPGSTFRGQVTYISSFLDPATRTAQARVEIDNHDGRLRPGMFATASLTAAAAVGRNALVVPRDAVQQVRGTPVVFVETQAGVYEMRQVALGQEAGADVEVLSGLAADERVVTEGAFYLKATVLKEEMGEHD
ncbi:MAG: RND transporter [Fimbriimonadales bacterium]|nr:MAG: RND transporter [Fimbriimonadales bacterium]